MLLLLFPAALLLSPRARVGGIIGGHEAEPHSRPYTALVRIKPWLEPVSTSGGFLLRPDVVVTAAHCRLKRSRGTVLLGAHSVRKRERSWQEIGVRRWIPHPLYDKSNQKNDIMLLQLRREAQLTAQVQPLPLPQPWPPAPVRSPCSVARWGHTQAHPPALGRAARGGAAGAARCQVPTPAAETLQRCLHALRRGSPGPGRLAEGRLGGAPGVLRGAPRPHLLGASQRGLP